MGTEKVECNSIWTIWESQRRFAEEGNPVLKVELARWRGNQAWRGVSTKWQSSEKAACQLMEKQTAFCGQSVGKTGGKDRDEDVLHSGRIWPSADRHWGHCAAHSCILETYPWGQDRWWAVGEMGYSRRPGGNVQWSGREMRSGYLVYWITQTHYLDMTAEGGQGLKIIWKLPI